MSEEEKKAIKFLKKHIIPYYEYEDKIEFMLNDVVLNLIEKQQKEIENLKEKNMILEGNKIGQQLAINTLKNNIQEQAINSISKGKIRELIENNQDDIDYSIHDIIEDLKKLLKED